MLSKKAIYRGIGILKANGLTMQPESRDAIDAVAATWAATLADMTDDELEVALMTLLRNDETGRWPTPQRIRGFLPRVAVEAIDGADEAWGELIAGIKTGCAPGAAQNEYLFTRFNDRSYGPRWDWSGDDDERALKADALRAIGGWDHVADPVNGLNANSEGQFRAAFRNAYRAGKQRLRLVGESRVVEGLLTVGQGAPKLTDGGPR